MKAIEKNKITQQIEVNKKKKRIQDHLFHNRRNGELKEIFEIHPGNTPSYDFSTVTAN